MARASIFGIAAMAFALLPGPAAAQGCATPPPASAAAQVMGTGAPTVVFESGLGTPLANWGALPRDVAAFTTAFVYERPGYAGSPLLPGDADGSRTSDEVAAHLRQLLRANGVPAPYVLVGHSLAALYVLKFAELYPADVAAVVLLDGRLKGYTMRCQAAGGCRAIDNIAPDEQPAVAAELRGVRASDFMAPEPEALGSIPVTVISRSAGETPLDRLWRETQRDFASRLRNGRLLVAQSSGHNVPQDAPALVLSEIRAAVERARSR